MLSAALAALLCLAPAAPDTTEPDCRTAAPRPVARRTSATPRAPQRGAPWSLGRQFEHVLVVVLENQDYDAVIDHPYFRELASRGALLTHYDGLFHPSYPNYLALIGGRYFGTIENEQRDLPASARTIADLLEPRGLTWRQYAEGYPGGCFGGSGASGALYRRKHVPFMSFESITRVAARCRNVVSATEFDPRKLPAFAIYSPDMCHDGHDLCGHRSGGGEADELDQAARWLEGFLTPLLSDAEVMKDTLVVITFDESQHGAHNHIYTVLLGGMVTRGAEVHACYDHYNLLRTIEDNFGLGTLGAEDERSAPITGGAWRAQVRRP
jgi:hypothetical protein